VDEVTPAFFDQRAVAQQLIQKRPGRSQVFADILIEDVNNGKSQYITIHQKE
jgi:hypothetical protein